MKLPPSALVEKTIIFACIPSQKAAFVYKTKAVVSFKMRLATREACLASVLRTSIPLSHQHLSILLLDRSVVQTYRQKNFAGSMP